VPVALGTPLAVTSVPEPSTLVLFCVAMAGLVLFLPCRPIRGV
jgi:hypothetical protein